MRRDRLGRLGLAALPEIGMRSDHDPPHLADMACDQRRIRQMPDPDREIDAVFDEIDHAIRQPQFGRDLGIARQIARHHRTDMEAAESDRRRDHQPPTRPGAFALGRTFGLLDIGEDAPDPFQIARADIG